VIGPFAKELDRLQGTSDVTYPEFQGMLSKDPSLPIEIRDGTTMLVEAAARGQDDTIRFLLDAGANPNAMDNEGFTALHRLIERLDESESTLDTIAFLIQSGANVELVGHNGWRPLHQAATYGLSKVVDLLLRMGADVNARNDAIVKERALGIALRLERADLAVLLRGRGARV
jgi:ankyrin repeat protein